MSKIEISKDAVLEIIRANPGIKFNEIGALLGFEVDWAKRAGPDFEGALDSACQALRRKELIRYDKVLRGWYPTA